jgi:hypothetical protein
MPPAAASSSAPPSGKAMRVSLANAGIVSAGGDGAIGASSLDGGFGQASTGTLVVDFEFGGDMDLIAVSDGGQPALAGIVDPEPQGALPKSGATGGGRIVTAAGFADSGLAVANTAAVTYALATDGDAIALCYEVDYAPWAGNAAAQSKVTAADRRKITSNHTTFGRHVGRADRPAQQRSPDEFPGSGLIPGRRPAEQRGRIPLHRRVRAFPSRDPRGRAARRRPRQLCGAEVFAAVDGMIFASRRFADALMTCPEQNVDGTVSFNREGSCLWGRIGGVASRRDGNDVRYDEDVFAITAGLQAEVADGWFAGAALGYESATLSGDVSGDGDRFHLGAVIKREIGATTLSASLLGGVGEFSLARQVFTPGGMAAAKGDPDGRWLAAHARVAHRVDIGARSYAKPWLDLGLQHFRQDAFTESGAGEYGLRVDAIEHNLVSLAPTLEIGTSLSLLGMAAEATFTGGALAFFSDTDRATRVALVGVGPDGPGFTVTDGVDDVFATLGASLKGNLGARTTIEADLGALLGDDYQSFGGAAKLIFAF